MLKFLRKYDKWILAVGGTLLMIVFLLPQAMQQVGGDPRDRVIATFADGKITLRERYAAQQDIETLKAMHPSIPYLLLGLDTEGNEAPHWLLLAEEAQRAGFVGGPEDGAQFMELAAAELGRIYAQQYFGASDGLSPQMVAYIQQNFYDQLLAARAALIGSQAYEADLLRIESIAMGILRLHKTYFEAPRLSDVESVGYAKRQADQVAVNYCILRPARVLQDIPQPTRAEVEAHFEKYRDVVPGEGEYGFGYRLFPGVKIQWIEFKREDIGRAVTIDPIAANSHWRANRNRYPGEWVDSREQVERDLREAEIDRILADLDQFMVGELRKRERNLPADGRFKKLPEDWDLIRPSLQATVDNAIRQAEQSNSLDLPEMRIGDASERFYIEEDADRWGDIFNSTLQRGPSQVPFSDLVFNAREINPETPYDVQVGLTYGPLRDAGGNAFYFVLTDARPSQPADLTTEMEGRCRDDMRRLAAMEALLAASDNFIAEVGAKGVVGFGRDLGLPEIDIVERAAVGRGFVNPAQTMDFDQESIRNAIIDRAESIDPTVPALQLPAAVRTLVLPSPKAQAVVVVEIIDNRPLTLESYRTNIDQAEALADRDLFFADVDEWPFSWAAMSSRLKYKSFNEDDELAEEEEAAAATADAGGA